MSRRNQARRRRSYGRRQHEVRERRIGDSDDSGLESEGDSYTALDAWRALERDDEGATYRDAYRGLGR